MSPATQPRVYRGATLEEVLPQIREELGDDAVITRQREGIVGGIGGFFGRRCVEVEAVAAEWLGLEERPQAVPAGMVSQAYEPPDEDALMAEVVSNPVIRRLIEQSTPFAEHLKEALGDPEPGEEVDAVPASEPERHAMPAPGPELGPAEQADIRGGRSSAAVPAPWRPSLARTHDGADVLPARAAEALSEAGLAEAVARAVVEEVERHVRPFAPHEAFTTQLRRVLARRIPVAHGFKGNRRTIVLAGPSGAGRTLAAARIARAYASAGIFEVGVLDLSGRGGPGTARAALEGTPIDVRSAVVPEDAARVAVEMTGPGRVLVVDTPPVLGSGPAARPRPAELIAAVAPDEVHVVVPAAMDDGLAAFVLEAIVADASRDRLLVTRIDEPGRAGAVLGLAIERRLPVSYVSSGPYADRGLLPADPVMLASMLMR
jgi:flagellar biosynthesis GTPase FlhF